MLMKIKHYKVVKGWNRYLFSNTLIKLNNFPSYTNGKIAYCYLCSGSGSGSFKFNGTRLRINGNWHASYAKELFITIDGFRYENIIKPNSLKRGVIFEVKDLPAGEHTVDIQALNPSTEWAIRLFSVDVSSDNNITNLIATPENSSVTLKWDKIVNCTDYVIQYGTSPGKYTERINTSVDSYKGYTVDNLINGTTYYFAVCPIVEGLDGSTVYDGIFETLCTNETSATPGDTMILYMNAEKEKIKVGEFVNTSIEIDNVTEIAAEDIIVKYNTEKLQFIDFEEIDGIKLVYTNENNGELRFILASKGSSNIVNSRKSLLNLKFKGKAVGEALVDITKGKISDGIEMEKELAENQCGQATIIIEGFMDVNNSGEFTLLDLAIDARHLYKDPSSEELSQYNTDIVNDGMVDEKDLVEIAKLMLLNPNYHFNN